MNSKMDTKAHNIEELLAKCPKRGLITAYSTNVYCNEPDIHLASLETEQEAKALKAQLINCRKRKAPYFV